LVVSVVVFAYARCINALITCVLTAAVIYFLVVMPLKVVEERRRRGEEEGPADPTDVELLTEIRDLLREQRAGAGSASAGSAGTGSAGTGSQS
jgi:large conductance mechanosensitive channel